jgi:hypothetical protein
VPTQKIISDLADVAGRVENLRLLLTLPIAQDARAKADIQASLQRALAAKQVLEDELRIAVERGK